MTKEEIAELIDKMPQDMDVNDFIHELVNRALAVERKWVGLTDEEKGWCGAPTLQETVARVEAKLKEKNTCKWVGLNSFDRTLLRTTYAPLKPLHHIKDTDIVAEVVNDWEAFFTAIEEVLKDKNT